MRAGTLRHRVTIQQLVAGSPQQLGTGEPDDDWAAVATVWAEVKPLSGNALVAAQQIVAQVNTEITIRYRAGIIATMRAVLGSDVFDIRAVIDHEKRHRSMKLLCTSGVNQG